MIRCAIAGLGRWGRSLVEAAQRGGRLHITHAIEPDAEAAREFCAAHQLARAENLDAVLADPAIKAVLLATPHSQHLAQVIAAAMAGKQVFCEKPLGLRREHAARMFGACRTAGVVLAVGHNRRFWPSLRMLREIVARGELGTILHVEGHNSNENSLVITQGWRLSPEFLGVPERPLIERLITAGMLSRDEATRLGVSQTARRGDLAYWLARAFGWREAKPSGAFEDWQRPPTQASTEHGLPSSHWALAVHRMQPAMGA